MIVQLSQHHLISCNYHLHQETTPAYIDASLNYTIEWYLYDNASHYRKERVFTLEGACEIALTNL